MAMIADRTRLSSWGSTTSHAVAGRITETTFVPGPELDSRYTHSIRFELRDGENAPYDPSTSERCEVQSSFPSGTADNGSELWVSWWEYFDPSWPVSSGQGALSDRWCICMQFHASVNQPALVGGVIGDNRRVERNPTGTGAATYSPLRSLQRGEWVFNKIGVLIRSDTNGWVVWKRGGETVWNTTGIRTLPSGSSGFYPKIGIYRNGGRSGTAIMHYSGVTYWDAEPPDPSGETAPPPDPPADFEELVDDERAYMVTKATQTAGAVATTAWPQYVNGPRTGWVTTGANGWTTGFWPGLCWLLYDRTGDAAWRTRAENWQANLTAGSTTAPDFNTGFIFWNTYARGFDLTADTGMRTKALAAATYMQTFWNATVGAYRYEAGPPTSVLVDSAPTVELLFWSTANGGDAAHATRALTHLQKLITDFQRVDGSVWQRVRYDAGGTVTSRDNTQGLSSTSTWARAQAWFAYGVAMGYRLATDAACLTAARAVLDWYMTATPADGVPRWDYQASAGAPMDTSTAAIILCAFADMAELDPDASRRGIYASYCETLIRGLAANHSGSADPSILDHGTYNNVTGVGVDRGLSWGDMFYADGLERVTTITDPLPNARPWSTAAAGRFGASDTGTEFFTIGPNSERSSEFTMGGTDKRTNMVVAYLDGGGGGGAFQPLRATIRDAAGNLLAVSAENSLGPGAAADEYPFPFPTYVTLEAGETYRIGLIAGGTTATLRYGYQVAPATPLNLDWATATYSSGPSATWTPAVSQTDRTLAVMAVVEDVPSGADFNTGTLLFDEPFTYTDGVLATVSGGRWGTPVATGDGAWRVASNQGRPATTGTWRGSYTTDTGYNPADGDGDYVFHLAALPQAIGNQFFGHICGRREGESGSTSGPTLYGVNVTVDAGPDVQLGLDKAVNYTSYTNLIAATTITPTAAPLYVGIRRDGTTLTVYWSDDGTTWIEHDSTTDADLTGGRIMVESNSGQTAVERITHRALPDAGPSNEPPAAGFTRSIANPVAGDTVTFTSTATDVDGSIVLYEWDLDGDGVFEVSGVDEVVASETYPAPGDYLVRHRVTDNDGGLSTTAFLLLVVADPDEPTDPDPPVPGPEPPEDGGTDTGIDCGDSGPLAWLAFDNLEVGHEGRVLSYLANRRSDANPLGNDVPAGWRVQLTPCCPCPVLLTDDNGTQVTFRRPDGMDPEGTGDPAPWFDPDHPESIDFMGVWITSIQGLDSVVTRPSQARGANPGGSFLGRQTQGVREVKVEATLIANTCPALDYGRRWLAHQLATHPCDDCGTGTLEVRTTCPPGTSPPASDLGLRTLYGVGLTNGPSRRDEANPDGVGCDYMNVEWTMVAEDPWLYDCPVECLPRTLWGDVGEVDEGPGSGSGDDIVLAWTCRLPTTGIVGQLGAVIEVETGSIPGVSDAHFRVLGWDLPEGVECGEADVEQYGCLDIYMSGVPGNTLVTIDGARHRITVRDMATGFESDGFQYVQLDDGELFAWPDTAGCLPTCLSVVPKGELPDDAAVTISTRRRYLT